MRTSDIDLAAAITAATEIQPTLTISEHRKPLTVFVFPDNDATLAAAARHASGELFLSTKRVLSCRGLLFRQMREGRQ